MLFGAYGNSQKLAAQEIKGRTHTLALEDWTNLAQWLACAKAKRDDCVSKGAHYLKLLAATVASTALFFM